MICTVIWIVGWYLFSALNDDYFEFSMTLLCCLIVVIKKCTSELSSTNKITKQSKSWLYYSKSDYNCYTKKIDAYTHLITYLYAVLCGYDSISEGIIGMYLTLLNYIILAFVHSSLNCIAETIVSKMHLPFSIFTVVFPLVILVLPPLIQSSIATSELPPSLVEYQHHFSYLHKRLSHPCTM